ncbi:MAG TPA: DNA topoisomerase IB [Reyranellaceae bacterium]|nr:DNA topoisomerase IB [Reyranellaceae bacterium]
MSRQPRNLAARLAEERGLRMIGPDDLTIRRQRCGKGFTFVRPTGATLRDKAEIARLRSLAVPPAYTDVRYAADPMAHLQAIGTDAAGRLQYRYHAQWAEVREARKARRLARLARALPAIRRAVGRCLANETCDARFAAAAVVELVSLTALRAGSEEYAKERGTRGATTLLKSNVRVADGRVSLQFKAKGGKTVAKEVRNRRFLAAVRRLLALPGRRLFQYREGEDVRTLRAPDVNRFLQEVAGRRISLKDFRTLVASIEALDALVGTEPAASKRARRSQVRAVVSEVAEGLANTPTICRKSYVHGAVVTAFEKGALARNAKLRRSTVAKAEALARVVARHS